MREKNGFYKTKLAFIQLFFTEKQRNLKKNQSRQVFQELLQKRKRFKIKFVHCLELARKFPLFNQWHCMN